ncbi:MAG: RNA polymerase subunit sigma-24 [Micavibrio aeruginosavorus]|uniref:RNA polymerase subunit sigma-24 n=1 Tax=Micavibrio aeruginosavorus TaxID=349221 RepID=A0A2W5A221_9BACT|nr:MAG: RNA polymerase subunit sigma-24 [Micavibrio aeruginosavorus]
MEKSMLLSGGTFLSRRKQMLFEEKGDTEMFTQAELVQEMPKLRKFASKLTRSTAQAEDLLQSTLLRALEKSDYFETGTDLFKWTSKVMYNIFVTDYRRKVKFESQYDPDFHIENRSVAPDQHVKMEVKAMAEAMNHMSAEHKEILVLVCVKGMQYQEVAEALNIPVGTVRSRLSRARNQLIALMEGPATPGIGQNVYELGASQMRAAA